ncbi:MAG: hypothetical protein J7L96_10730 [Bacteroidales bacterium]|nr:hypothetical protein [Bacteroidales bacterium]
MKKLFLLAGVVAMIFSSCTQDLPGPDQNAPREVIFNTSGNGLLKTDMDCSLDADYATIQINGTVYTAATFVVNDVLYTQAIKLAPATYTLEMFTLWNDNDTPGDTSDDIMVSAAPHAGAPYADMVINALDLVFDVDAFLKVEVEVGVLCYEESTHDNFGFVWFKPTKTHVKQKWFFGDFCTKFFDDYSGSDYDGQTNGLQVDMPAIYEIEVIHNGVSQGTYTNVGTLGEAPLSVPYVDDPNATDNYEFRLSVLVKVGTTFEYKYFGSFLFTDDGDITTDIGVGPGADGVYDFVIGNCLVTDADFSLAPYMNLPETGTLVIGSQYAAGTMGTYLDVKLTGIGTGYDVDENVWYGSYCFDRGVGIQTDHSYSVNIYSSLYPDLMPANMEAKPWEKVNWLINHLDQFPGYTWGDFQQAMWTLEDSLWSGAAHAGAPAKTSITDDMVAAANANGVGYVPLPGGWAAVTFENDGAPIQTVFIVVDP